jgi:hypothetical protein
MTFKNYLMVCLIVNFSLVTSAYAYIDPNTGGFFFQTVAPFVYGILGIIVVFWKRISGFFKGIFGRNKDSIQYPQDD